MVVALVRVPPSSLGSRLLRAVQVQQSGVARTRGFELERLVRPIRN